MSTWHFLQRWYDLNSTTSASNDADPLVCEIIAEVKVNIDFRSDGTVHSPAIPCSGMHDGYGQVRQPLNIRPIHLVQGPASADYDIRYIYEGGASLEILNSDVPKNKDQLRQSRTGEPMHSPFRLFVIPFHIDNLV